MPVEAVADETSEWEDDAAGDVETEHDPLFIDAGGQITWAVGGKAPSGSTLRVTGGKFTVGGQYKKGETIKVELTMTVMEVAFTDLKDAATGLVISTERRHKASVIGVAVL